MNISICDLLLTLVSPLHVDILVEWLSLQDVGRLDSAICATQHRELFLSTLKEEFCVFKEASKDNYCQFLWIIERRVKMADVEMPREFTSRGAHATFLQVSGKYLRRLNASYMFETVKEDDSDDFVSGKLAVLANCFNLNQLQLRCVNFRSLDVGPLLSVSPHLQYLDLAFCKNVRSELLFGITNHAKSLHTVNLVGCKLSGEIDMALITDNHTIQTLHVGSVKESPYLVPFARHCKALRVLYAKDIEWNDVLAVLSHCPVLRGLSAAINLTTDPRLTADQTYALIPLIQGLECLHLDYGFDRFVEDEYVLDIVTHCPHLKALMLATLFVIRGHTIENIFDAIMQVPSKNASVHQLNTLYVGRIDAATLQSILTHCPQLTSLVYTDMWPEVDTHDLMTTIGQSTITSLSLHACNDILSGDLLPLRNLSSLTLNCFSLTDKDVVGLVDRNPNLRVLSLTGAPTLTKKSILYIVKNCKHLEELKFDNHDPTAPIYKLAMADTSLLTDVVLFFRPNLKKLVIRLTDK